MILAAFFTRNLLVIGAVRGLIIALIAMGIVLVYRSTRVINFAVGDLGVPAAGLLGVMAGAHGWPYWPALIGALARRHAGRRARRAVGRAPAVPRAARHRARRDDRRRPARAGGHADPAGVPDRIAVVDVSPCPFKSEWHLPGDVILKGGPDPRPDRRAAHHRRACGGCSATPRSASRCGRRSATPTSPA